VRLAPVFLGDKVLLFDHADSGMMLEMSSVTAGNGVTHLTFRPHGMVQA